MTDEELLLQIRNDVLNYLTDELLYKFTDTVLPFNGSIDYENITAKVEVDKDGKGHVNLIPKNDEGYKQLLELSVPGMILKFTLNLQD